MNAYDELRAIDKYAPHQVTAPEEEDVGSTDRVGWYAVAYLRIIAYLLCEQQGP